MTDPTQPPLARSFGQFLAAVEDGVFHQDLTDALKGLVADLHNHARDVGGKPRGRLSLDLSFQLDSGLVEITAEFKAVSPKAPRGKTIMWATPENFLTPRNPRQPDLPFRDVTSPVAARTAG